MFFPDSLFLFIVSVEPDMMPFWDPHVNLVYGGKAKNK